jgi:transcription initiation factor TFIIB
VLPERLVDPGQEWRDFADSTDDKSRVSGVNDLLKGGLGTTITGDAGEFGKLHNRLIDNADRHVLMASDKIDTLSNLLHIPDTIADRAKRIYKQFEDKRTKSMRYRHEGIIAAILYMACKEADFPRTFKELSRDTDIDENSIRKYYRMVNKLLERSGSSAVVSMRPNFPFRQAHFCI